MFRKFLIVAVACAGVAANAAKMSASALADRAAAAEATATVGVVADVLKGTIGNEAGLVGKTYLGIAVSPSMARGVYPLAKVAASALSTAKVTLDPQNLSAYADEAAKLNLNSNGVAEAFANAAKKGFSLEVLKSEMAAASKRVINLLPTKAQERPASEVLAFVSGTTDAEKAALAPGALSADAAERVAADAHAVLTTTAEACAKDGDSVSACVAAGFKDVAAGVAAGLYEVSAEEYAGVSNFNADRREGFQGEQGRATTLPYQEGSAAALTDLGTGIRAAQEAGMAAGEFLNFATVAKTALSPSQQKLQQCYLTGQAL